MIFDGVPVFHFNFHIIFLNFLIIFLNFFKYFLDLCLQAIDTGYLTSEYLLIRFDTIQIIVENSFNQAVNEKKIESRNSLIRGLKAPLEENNKNNDKNWSMNKNYIKVSNGNGINNTENENGNWSKNKNENKVWNKDEVEYDKNWNKYDNKNGDGYGHRFGNQYQNNFLVRYNNEPDSERNLININNNNNINDIENKRNSLDTSELIKNNAIKNKMIKNKPDTMRKNMTQIYDELLRDNKAVVYIGEDVEHGGYYLVTEGLAKKYPLR